MTKRKEKRKGNTWGKLREKQSCRVEKGVGSRSKGRNVNWEVMWKNNLVYGSAF